MKDMVPSRYVVVCNFNYNRCGPILHPFFVQLSKMYCTPTNVLRLFFFFHFFYETQCDIINELRWDSIVSRLNTTMNLYGKDHSKYELFFQYHVQALWLPLSAGGKGHHTVGGQN